MRKVSVFFTILFLASGLAAAVYDGGGRDAQQPKSKRIIAQAADGLNIGEVGRRGCNIRHRLGGETSFNCPTEANLTGLKYRESRLFYIMDSAADQQIHADDVWAAGVTGQGVTVAVLDTGIDTDHPELADSYVGGYDYVNNRNVPEDDHGHGTHVAGIITSNGAPNGASKGVAPGAGIIMYKVCNSKGSCYEDDMLAAMDAAVASGAKVMSISIGGGSYTTSNCDSDPLAAKVNWAVSQGVTAVVAAGNDGRGVSTPGCASGAIAVGAVDVSAVVPYWSGRGPALDIVAPGVSIYSTYRSAGYAWMSGTSMATPHVSGVAALLLSANPALNPTDIRNALYATADPVSVCMKCTLWNGSICQSQSAVTCTSDITGAGVVDAYGSYLLVAPTTSTSTTSTTTSSTTTLPPTTTTTLPSTTTTSTTSSTTTTTEPPTTTSTSSTSTTTTTEPPTTTSTSTSSTTTTTEPPTTTSTSSTSTTTTTEPPTTTSTSTTSTSTTSSTTTTTLAPVRCWSGSNRYLLRDSAQYKKFCKCAQGGYGYQGASTSSRKNLYRFSDAGNNMNWAVSYVRNQQSVSAVRCLNGVYYYANQNQYYRS